MRNPISASMARQTSARTASSMDWNSRSSSRMWSMRKMASSSCWRRRSSRTMRACCMAGSIWLMGSFTSARRARSQVVEISLRAGVVHPGAVGHGAQLQLARVVVAQAEQAQLGLDRAGAGGDDGGGQLALVVGRVADAVNRPHQLDGAGFPFELLFGG